MMSDQAKIMQELFTKRMTLVSEISQLNADQLHNTQQLSGSQIDRMRCEEAIADQPTRDEAREELSQIEARERSLQSRISDNNEKIAKLEEQVAALDRKLNGL